MSLFRRRHDNSAIKFDCYELSIEEFTEIKNLVEENGGELGMDELPIRFVNRETFKTEMLRTHWVFDVEYIRTCVRESKLCKLYDFRLGPEKACSHCIAYTYIHGHCIYKSILKSMRKAVFQDDKSVSSRDDKGKENDTPKMTPEENQEIMDVLSTSANESQDVVSRPYSRRLRNGVETSQRAPSKSREKENTQCEYTKDVNPNVTQSSELPATRETVTTAESVYGTPLDLVGIKEETPDTQWGPAESQSWSPEVDLALALNAAATSSPRVNGKSPTNGENNSRIEAVSPSSFISSSSRATDKPSGKVENDSTRETTCSISLKVPKIVLEPCSVPMKTASTHESREKYPWLTVIKDAYMALTPENISQSQENDAPRMSDLSHNHSVSELVQRNDGKASQLRPNPMFNNSLKEFDERSGTSTDCSRTSVNCARTSPDCLKTSAERSTKVRNPLSGMRKKKVPTDEQWNLPGPSGVKARQASNVDCVVLDSSSDDDDDLSARTNSEAINNKVTHGNNRKAVESKEDDTSDTSSRNNETSSGKRKLPSKRQIVSADSEEESEVALSRRTKLKQSGRKRLRRLYTDSNSETEVAASNSERHPRVNTRQHRESSYISNSSDTEKDNEAATSSDAQSRVNTRYKRRNPLPYNKQIKGVNKVEAQSDDEMPALRTCLAYTNTERNMMVKYLLTFRDFKRRRPKGLQIWKEMRLRGLTTRTAGSLQNHFVKHLLPSISDYFDIMNEKQKQMFRDLQDQVPRKH